MVENGWIKNPLRNSVHEYGFLYHPYASGLCMGRCPMCRDHTKDTRLKRKERKAEFRSILKMEVE